MKLDVGQVVEHYRVERVLGAGGTAIVYLVRDQRDQTPHALKVLTISSPAIRERMLREGRVQAKLKHLNVVAVTDVLELEGSPALLMELIEGPSLEAALQHYRLTMGDAELLFGGILAGVRAAHGAGLVHRDLKPANVLLAHTREGFVPKVTDFGLAKVLVHEPGVAHTRAGISMGTPSYMAPEQIRDARAVDQRADIWSLGCVLYELMTRRRAFPGEEALAIYNAVVDAEFEPPRRFLPDLPDRINTAILGCLELHPDDRIPDCETLRAVLRGELEWELDAEVELGPPLVGAPTQRLPPAPSIPDVPPMPLAGRGRQGETPAGLQERSVELGPPILAPSPIRAASSSASRSGGFARSRPPQQAAQPPQQAAQPPQQAAQPPGLVLLDADLLYPDPDPQGFEDQQETVVLSQFDGTLAPPNSFDPQGRGMGWLSWLFLAALGGLFMVGVVLLTAGGVVGVFLSEGPEGERAPAAAAPAPPAPVEPQPPAPVEAQPRGEVRRPAPPRPRRTQPAPAPAAPAPAAPAPAPAAPAAPASATPDPAAPAPVSPAPVSPSTAGAVRPAAPAPAPSTDPAPAGDLREVRLLSTPFGAEIVLDNEPVGRTPKKLSLRPGRYPVRMTSDGQEVWFVINLEAQGPSTWCYKFPDNQPYIGTCP